MSLLLEALKKAELAKQASQPESPSEPQPETRPEIAAESTPEKPAVRSEELSIVQDFREPVITRESLPDITQTLEIRSEDFASAKSAPKPRQPAEPGIRPQTVAEPAADAAAVEPAPAKDTLRSREAARQVFDVKEEVDYNPRRPFYMTVGALIVAGIGYGTYVWWQMQPHYAVNTAAVQVSKPPGPGAAVPPAQVPAAAPPTTAAAEPAPKPPAAATPKVTPSAETTAASSTPSGPVFRASRDATARTAQTAENPAGRSAEQPPITVTPATARTDPALDAAYGAYQSGDWARSRAEYERVLEREPTNRDALLGLAAVDLRNRGYETAELRYLKLLELNPRDSYAIAGLLSLQGNVDPLRSESRIKSLLASQPEATHLYFTLGNLYAVQDRWAEAQDAYFRAYSANPENPDYAFNLAVSLDRLRQAKPALEYYRKALALTTKQPAGFDRAQAEARAAELQR